MDRSGVFVHIRINATRSNQASWGETQFAEGLARAIRRHPGCDASVIFRGERPETSGRPAVLLQIVGPHLEEPVPGIANLLWIISPPNIMPQPMLRRYQAIFSASAALAKGVSARGLSASYLPQATEAEHFHPRRRPEGAGEIPLVFVGGYAPRVGRSMVLDAVGSGFEPQIWGPGWKGIVPDHLWRGERLDYHALAETYASARIVLNSHMELMAAQGFMSNRSFDAVASGAHVVSDMISGFSAPELPEIRMVPDRAALVRCLEGLLGAPPADMAARIALHGRVATLFGFDRPALAILERARQFLQTREVARPAFCPGTAMPAAKAGVAPRLTDPAASAPDGLTAMRLAADQIRDIAAFLEQPGAGPVPPPAPAKTQGVIHALMHDLRTVQKIAQAGLSPQNRRLIEDLVARARRISDILDDPAQVDFLRRNMSETDRLLVGILRNEPLWAHSPEGFSRQIGKTSLRLRSRRDFPDLGRPPGVFLHLYYDALAPIFAERLAHIGTPFRLYVSTDSKEKAGRIRASLPDAEIRVLENRGRDIWPKLYGFADAHDDHDIVLHLHGKRSVHSDKLDAWLAHNLDCLLGSPGEVNRILSLFSSIPRLGMVTPVTFRAVLGAAHWGANREIAQELAFRMGLGTPLPDDRSLRFPVGSMFWGRTAAIRPLLDLRLAAAHFPTEAGQVDGTLAHAIERMLGVICRATDHHLLPVSGGRTHPHQKYQLQVNSNRDLREALEKHVFDSARPACELRDEEVSHG